MDNAIGLPNTYKLYSSLYRKLSGALWRRGWRSAPESLLRAIQRSNNRDQTGTKTFVSLLDVKWTLTWYVNTLIVTANFKNHFTSCEWHWIEHKKTSKRGRKKKKKSNLPNNHIKRGG